MTTIGILSDTHGYLDDKIFKHFADCDLLLHAGDIGSLSLLEHLQNFKTTHAVFGNIDGYDLKTLLPEYKKIKIENILVFLTHIGGYPGKYNPDVLPFLANNLSAGGDAAHGQPIQLFVCGHSHILKVQYDHHYHMLTVNPGAAGKQGWQTCQTLVKLRIDKNNISDLQVIELH